MASERQIAANRRNALKSTGPRTAAGRAKSSRNACRHGLRAGLRPNQPAEVERMARLLGGGDAGPLVLSWAHTAAEASLDIVRIRRVSLALIDEMESLFTWLDSRSGEDIAPEESARIKETATRLVKRLDALTRYENRADARSD